MKRGREDNGYGPGQKRPSGPPSNPYRRPVGPSQMSRLTTSDALSYLRDVKAKFADNKDTYDTFLEIMKKFKAQIITTEGVIEQVKSLFRGHRELILGFNTFLPKGFEIQMPLDEDEQPKAAVEFDQAINYVNKIKTRFSSDERVYKAFLEILNMYRKGQKTITNVYEEVAMLFKNHNDLLEEFTYFLPDATPPALQSAPVKKITARARGQAARVNGDPDYGRGMRGSSRSAADVGKELQWMEKVKAKLKSKDGYQEFLKTLNLYATDIISRGELVMMVQDIMARHNDIASGFDNFLSRLEIAEYEPEMNRSRMTRETTRHKTDKYGARPISDLDVSTWEVISLKTGRMHQIRSAIKADKRFYSERSTTSYVKLPKGYPKLKASHVTPLGASVLQDDWVSVTSGSEDYSFKHMRKNQYEEALFRCEDDRFELDMAIECSLSAVKALRDAVNEIAGLDAEGRERYRLDRSKVLSIHFRMVQKIYGTAPGERGAEMVDLLKKNPAVAAEVVLGRLMQKVEEWQADKRKMTEVWQKMYDANYHKSLDHRSFYFKQMDKKTLGQKTMMQEIKDIAERRRLEDQNIYLATTNFTSRLTPDLVFDDRHECVHNDVRKLIKYSMEDMLAPAAADQALDFWHTIVDPFFGLPPQQRDPSMKAENREEQKPGKANLTALRLQALSGDNGQDSTAPSVTDPGDQEDPASVLDALGEIAGDRVAATAKAEQAGTSEDGVPLSETGDVEAASLVKMEMKEDSVESDQSCLDCKPLAPTDHVRQAHQPEDALEAGRIFYGNEAFYQFFRLHQHMYERLKTARKCALQISRGPSFRSKPEQEQEDAISHMDEQAVQVHNQFMTLVSDLIDGTQDSSVYEDACRHLLGTNSYTLFTLDKLIYKLVKQLQLILADDASMKLAELYRYERSRGGRVIDAVYYQNAHIILHEDSTFRFESSPKGPFTVQLLETDRSEVPAGLLQADFLNYLESYTDVPASIGGLEVEAKTRRPFLKRTMMQVNAATDEDKELMATEGTSMRNGLECKLMTSTSKVSYVLDTEDWFRRKRHTRGKGFDRQWRKEHFEEWLRNAAKDAALMQLSAASMMMQAPMENAQYPAPIPG